MTDERKCIYCSKGEGGKHPPLETFYIKEGVDPVVIHRKCVRAIVGAYVAGTLVEQDLGGKGKGIAFNAKTGKKILADTKQKTKPKAKSKKKK